MNNRKENQIALKLRETRKRRWQIGLLLCLSLLVTAGIAGLFHLPAIAKTYQVIELTCTAEPPVGEACADFFVHIHNDDCYDSYGNLVCPLPEIKPHRHTEECYTTTSVLVCGLPESDGHQHTADCYTSVRGDLICELSTEPVLDEAGNLLEAGHVHTDECYEWREELTCGMEEGQGAHHHDDSCYQTETTLTCDKPEILLHTHTEDCYEIDADGNVRLVCGQVQVLEHVHGPECFTVYELDDGEPEEPGAETGLMTDLDTDTEPAVSGEFVFMDEYYGDESGDETDESKTDVAGEASETIEETEQTDGEPGEPDADTDTEPAVSGEFVFMDEYYGDESSDETDESKTDVAGEASETIEETEQTGEEPDETAAELSDEGTEETAAEPSDEETDETAEEPTDEETDGTAEEPTDEEIDETAKEQADEGTAKDTDQTDGKTGEDSPEEPLSVRMPAQNFEESTDTVMVRVAAPDGAFPPETTMRVTQIEIESVMDVVQESVGGEITRVQAVDISFFDADGNEIEPMVPIHVDMIPVTDSGDDETEEAAAAPDGSVQTILHVDNNGNTTVVEQKDGESTENSTVSFSADSFSVYILVYSNTLEKTVLASDGETYRITLSYDADAGIPADAELAVEEILPDSEEYKTYLQMAENSVENEMVSFARFFDITILSGGQEIQPAAPVDVKIELADTLEEGAKAIHFGEEVEVIDAEVTSLPEKTPDAETAENAGSETAFSAEGFSVYGVIVTTLEKTITASDGNTYSVNVTYGANAKIPVDAVLSVEEILSESERYNDYVNETETVLGLEAGSLPYARFFDITILGAEEEKLQPAEGTTVAVSVQLLDREAADTAAQVLHFGEEETEILTNTVEGDTVAFEASSFSVYAIVDAPESDYQPGGLYKADSLDKVANLGDQGFYVSYNRYYLTGGIVSGVSGNSDRNGLSATSAQYNSVPDSAVKFYFEKKEGSDNEFYIYTGEGESRKYVQLTPVSGNNKRAGLTLTDGADGTAFTLDLNNNKNFYVSAEINGKTYWWNRNAKDPGSGAFVGYSDKNDKNTAIISLQYEVETVNDPYGLGGKTYGIAYHDDNVTSAALTAESKTVTNNNQIQQRLAGLDMLMRPDVLDNEGILLVAENSDITEWTFESIGENRYYITTTVDGIKKYLTINNGNVTLEDQPSETASVITATPGSGSNKGKWHFTVGNYSLNLVGTTNNGFNAVTGNGATTWMNLVEKSVLEEDDFTLYTAQKVSVSDTVNVYNGQQVVIYTRVWNDTTKRYEFYAVDYDGSLIRCYDTGDNIEWIGSNVNSALWNFTEGKNTDGTPSYYYWLENSTYDNDFIVPQGTNDKVIYHSNQPDGTSDFKASVNLNGRRYGENFTTIICWDDNKYSFSGLKVENGRVVPCALDEAEDFYFAVVNPIDTTDQLSTVETIDNGEYGITMKMINFNNSKTGPADSPRDSVQNPFFGGDEKKNEAGLLSTDLTGGYPTTTDVTDNAGHSLSELFTGMTDVNHLFIESIHNESGYFEYDSTQNFAHLNDDGTFKVYDQIGSIGDYTRNTAKHGQFMPYNDLTAGKYILGFSNETDVLANELSDLDPRKGETLYNIGIRREVDYHFGMEMSAKFTQTPSGLDAWGHDIIFEFSGDDDFWLYVDGELILDIGGIHAASVGTINFRTGEVKTIVRDSDGKPLNNRSQTTTLYDVLRTNYQSRGMSDSEINQKLSEIFTQNADGQYVFKDYTDHQMKMFYMERGAGASNLHMRFNLAAVKPGSFILSKELSGAELENNNLIEFPYQIWYTSKIDGETKWHQLGEAAGDTDRVHYEGNSTAVKYAERFTPAGGKEVYDHVFFLKPGQSAEVELPDDATNYYVVECGINPDVYDQVSVNKTILSRSDMDLSGFDDYNYHALPGYLPTNDTVGETARRNYKTSADTSENRSRVAFDNRVSEGAMRTLSITKKLYDENGDPLPYPADDTKFSFRLYLGDENTTDENIPLANLYPYCVRDIAGNYCRWDVATQAFVAIEVEGRKITEYSTLSSYVKTLSKDEKDAIVFKTSMNGSISKIPADHTVEVRQLVIGSRWKVDEPGAEVPRGYTLRMGDGYTRVDVEPDKECGTTPISGMMYVDEDPEIEVRNQRGWGLTVQKIWTDKDFMESHDDIFFAVYRRGELLKDRVYRLSTAEREIYYYFDDLKDENDNTYSFDDFEVKEVMVSAQDGGTIGIAADGQVTNVDAVVIEPIQEDGILKVGGKPIGGSHQDDIEYTVSYDPGRISGKNNNVRIDTVTNSRPGIKLYKTLWNWEDPLADAVFTLKDADGRDVAAESYTSRESDGLITIAYLNPGTYTLTEIMTPKGYVALPQPLMIKVENVKGTIQVTEVTGPVDYYRFRQAQEAQEATETSPAREAEMASITIRNRPVELHVIKVDAENQSKKIEGVHFALYYQVTNISGDKVRDYLPIKGYEDLVTNENGIPVFADSSEAVTIENLNWDRTYYLSETEAAEDYDKLTTDLCFTIGKDGVVMINNSEYASWLNSTSNPETGLTSYTINVLNGKMKNIRLVKTDNSTSPVRLAGAEFDLYTKENYESNPKGDPINSQKLVSSDDEETKGEVMIGLLPSGEYVLEETKAPDGYKPLEKPIYFTVSQDEVTATLDGTSIEVTSEGSGSETVYTIPVKNEIALKKVSFKKVDIANTESALEGAVFDLYDVVDGKRKETPRYQALTSNADGILVYKPDGTTDDISVFELPVGVYHLVETDAPDGYNLKTDPVVVTVSAEKAPRGVSYYKGTALSATTGVDYNETTQIYTLLITNSSGYELPQTGGRGTALFTAIGAILSGTAGAILTLKRRREHA